jgi:hypothetical protein
VVKVFFSSACFLNSLVMATVDMNRIQFYRPPLSYTNSQYLRATSSLTQAPSPHHESDQILGSHKKSKPRIVAALDEMDDTGSQFESIGDRAVRSQGIVRVHQQQTRESS